MNWIETKNNEPVNLNEIPCLNIVDLRKEILEIKKRVVGFFGQPFGVGVKLFVVMADDEQGKLFISSAYFNENEKSYDSITKDIPAWALAITRSPLKILNDWVKKFI